MVTVQVVCCECVEIGLNYFPSIPCTILYFRLWLSTPKPLQMYCWILENKISFYSSWVL